MNDQRPTRWPCSADSSRNAGPEPRSFRNAETGVSVSSMNVSQTGTRLWVPSATPANEDLLRVGQAQAARTQQDGEVVEDIRGLLGDALVALLARGARDLLGLLLDLLPHLGGIRQQLDGVRARRSVGGARGDRALQAGQCLARHGRLVAVVEAGPLAGVAGGAGGLDEREHGVEVAVEPQRLHGL